MKPKETPAAILSDLLAFAQEAGRLALDLRAAGLETLHKGAGLGQALTEADLAISRLMHARFGPRLIEEETAEALARDLARRWLQAEDAWTFIGDPIDGTRPFAGGLAGWGSMIAGCHGGWPRVGAMMLPAWVDERDRREGRPAAEQRGLLLAAVDGRAYAAATRHGRMSEALRALPARETRTGHVGWQPDAARRFTLDYGQGFFPCGESGFIADAALLATGRLDAATFSAKLWDLAPVLPILEALGFSLHRWPDLAPAPRQLIDLFDEDYACAPDLWLVCKSADQAAALARAIRRAGA